MKRIPGLLALAAAVTLSAAAPAAPASVTDGAPCFEIVLRVPIDGGRALHGPLDGESGLERVATLTNPARFAHRVARLAKVLVRVTIVVLERLSGAGPRALGPR